ncbi:hypothetical protein HNP82_000770 [Catenibacillus scindens]|uniref:Radical SAM core domain-containing protein n=1 Tax=Catenibacillus scindens TaxID=673271 RepID=A0A7W8H8F7_9FIRM|nr:TIGR01212 family radical SAM protein [Catenibacillus scindens]MBB5263672.1 hypothetical protein [Catenibacillus scindens]
MKSERYHTYSQYLKNLYGEKVYKLPVNLPITCPNRLGGNGCTFCAPAGTGFEARDSHMSVERQLLENKEHIEKKYKAHKFIAYFQNYTNTFLLPDTLKGYLYQAANVKDIVEISISTRPDCISDDILTMLSDFKKDTEIAIHLELGLQTANYHTLKKIHRGHGLAEFIDAILRISRYGFTVCAHVILNLPGDTVDDVIETAKILSVLPVQMAKLHSLYIAKNSPMAQDYLAGKLTICSQEEYLERVVVFLEYVRPDMIIERLFSRIPEEDALFSNWGHSWWKLDARLREILEEKDIFQGDLCHYMNGPCLALLKG